MECFIFRYFNPISAHISGRIGENLMIFQITLCLLYYIAIGTRVELGVLGRDSREMS